VSVTCTVTFPAPFVRAIEFVAASSGQSLLDVKSTFVDIDTADGCTQVTSTSGKFNPPCFAPGASVSVASWDPAATDG
jgi:hypothetical protein